MHMLSIVSAITLTTVTIATAVTITQNFQWNAFIVYVTCSMYCTVLAGIGSTSNTTTFKTDLLFKTKLTCYL